MTNHRVASVGDLDRGCLLRVEADGRLICLARHDNGGFAAIDDVCTHEEQSLSEGDLEGGQVECPAHGSRFDLETGEPSGFPAELATTVYQVTVDGDDVLIDLP